MCCHPAITLSCLCVRNEATTGGQFTKLDRPTGLLFSFAGKAYIEGWLGVCVVVCRVVKVFSTFLQCRVNNFEIWHTCYPHRCPTTCGIIILIIVFMDFFSWKIGQNLNFWRFGAIFSRKFQCKTMKLGLRAHCGYFQGCVKNDPFGPYFWDPLDPQ